MRACPSGLVHRLLAKQVGCPPHEIRDDQRLGRDLGLGSCDLALVAIGIEEREGEHGGFPVEDLHPHMTVGDVVSAYETWSRRRQAPATAAGTGVPRARRCEAVVMAGGDDDEPITLRMPETLRSPETPRFGEASASGLHVLVAEDDPDMRSFLVASLRADGHRISEVADGAELLRVTSHEALEREPYDVIVSDVIMPGASGMAALMALNYEPAAPPVVLITAFADPDVHLWALQLGAMATFDKPFDIDDLRTVLLNVRVAAERAAHAHPSPGMP